MPWGPGLRAITPIKMTFNAVWTQLLHRSGPGCGVGLAGLARVLARLGNPQNQFSVLQVAGTNGKGSVCYLAAQALQQAGHKTGLFISPHLISPCERMRINGQSISRPALARAVQTVLQAEEKPLNFFEILTAAALVYFAQKGVDFAVLETGLGGRKDPTTVCTPAACVITSIGKDHCQLLGHSLAQIAQEKAGIIKPGVPVFCGACPATALREIKKQARWRQAPFFYTPQTPVFTFQRVDWLRRRLLLQKGRRVWPLALLGENQAANADVVYQALRFLGVNETALKKAFAAVRVPCRFEVLHAGKNTFVFDGAHNPPAVEGFIRFFAQSPWAPGAALVCGFMQDKDYPRMLRILAPHFPALFITQPPGPRAASLAAVRAALPRGVRASYYATPQRALRAAAQAYNHVAVCGSFYVAGQLRACVGKGLTELSDCD